ncbi:MAG TPA: NAD-dependent epimerase/dehydratase family protein [Candidatus Limnocylindrales bacterium]|nr:NAD-dependent epimerase/dehydratase family protein [Candidatus Limnocylindrales bacterium]
MTRRTVVVLGGDGYLGWPTALHLSRLGHIVIAVDSLVRRHWDRECGTRSLIPIRSMPERVRLWQALTGHQIVWHRADLRNARAVAELVREYQPDAVVHFAEQRSAPFSIVDLAHAAMTQINNVVGTLNLLFALRDFAPAAHLIKLGTMGEYGTPNIDIEEGFITIHHNGRSDRLPFPMQPGSFYHLSKLHDSHNIQFACRVWGLRATDLHQGVVYGASTQELDLDPRLSTRFDYDAIWGTVLNRFCVQAALGLPLTVYGKGGQTRGFLDIRDTVACIRLALENPSDAGEYRVFNQFTEQFSVAHLAERVQAARRARDLTTAITHLPNPRVEREEHYYSARHQKLIDLGLQPHYLGDTLIDSVIGTVERHAARVDPVELERPNVDWRTGGTAAWDGRVANQALKPVSLFSRTRSALGDAVVSSRSKRRVAQLR